MITRKIRAGKANRWAHNRGGRPPTANCPEKSLLSRDKNMRESPEKKNRGMKGESSGNDRWIVRGKERERGEVRRYEFEKLISF